MNYFDVVEGEEMVFEHECGHTGLAVYGDVFRNGKNQAIYSLIFHSGQPEGLHVTFWTEKYKKFCHFGIALQLIKEGVAYRLRNPEGNIKDEDIRLISREDMLALPAGDKDFLWAVCDAIIENDSRLVHAYQAIENQMEQ